jgi:transposase
MTVAAHIRSMLIHEATAFEQLQLKMQAERGRPSRLDEQTYAELEEVIRNMRVMASKLAKFTR